MVLIPPRPETLARLGRYNDSLEEAVKKFTEPLSYIRQGLDNTVKYALFKKCEDPYLLIVSQQKDKLLHPIGYNIILTVTSYSPSRNHHIADHFQRETGIDLTISVPEQLNRQLADISFCFPAFEKNPEAAMNFLRGSY